MMNPAKTAPEHVLEEGRKVSDGDNHHEDVSQFDSSDERIEAARASNAADMPKGYYYSPMFIGTYCAIGLGLCGGDGTFALAAPLLNTINADLGPDPNIIWVSLSYTLGLAVCLTLVGRLSDIFGRRYFFIGGSVIATIGTVVCAVAQNVPTLIGGMVLVGVAAGAQMSFFWVLSELVPMEHRFIWNSGSYAMAIPFIALGPKISQCFQDNTKVHWRGIFYTMISVNALSTLLWIVFYHPPTFHMLHRSKTRMQIVREFDIVGLLMFTAGLLLFLMGLSWGGSAYPWRSAHVIATIIVGFIVLVAFFVWEAKGKLKDPFLPLHFFREIRFVSVMVIVTLAAMVYYAFSVIWPNMIYILYDDTPPSVQGWMTTIVGALLLGGEILGNIIAVWIAPKWLFISCSAAGAALLAAVAADPRNKELCEGLLIVGIFCLGICEGVGLTMCTVAIKNQEEIGTAGGISGSVRSTGSTIGGVVFNTVLANRLTNTISSLVPPAATKAGLPASSVPALISALQGLTPTKNVPGLNPAILDSATEAYKNANAQAYRTVFLTTLAFSVFAVIFSFFVGDNDEDKAQYVGVKLQQGKIPNISHTQASQAEKVSDN